MSDKENALITRYQARGIMRGMELLLPHLAALEFITECEAMGLVILGMDFYRQEGPNVVEVNAADYSSLVGTADAAKASACAARRLIRHALPDAADWVSFVIADAPE